MFNMIYGRINTFILALLIISTVILTPKMSEDMIRMPRGYDTSRVTSLEQYASVILLK